jgi:hypothetical protein
MLISWPTVSLILAHPGGSLFQVWDPLFVFCDGGVSGAHGGSEKDKEL